MAMEEVVRGFLYGGDATNHNRVMSYFEELKSSPEGWRQCLHTVLTPNMDPACKFFCLGVLEHFIKKDYPLCGEGEQKLMRGFITEWLKCQAQSPTQEPAYVANKFAHVVTQIVLVDFPSRWPSFFNDLMSVSAKPCWDVYLRILSTINQEIAERDVPRTPKEAARGTLIKDTMRETCVPQLVDSWYNILMSPGCNNNVYAMCLQTIGMFISWVDLGLICNDRFMPLLLNCLQRDTEIREATVECFTEIVHKGMEPGPKIQLVMYLLSLMEPTLNSVRADTSDEEIDFVIKLSRMVDFMATHVLVSCQKASPKKSSDLSGEQAAIVNSGTELIERRLFPLMEKFFSHPDDDVSAAVTESIREYLQFIKQRSYTDIQREIVKRTLLVIINKYKFDPDYDFDSQGEEEAEFMEYRRSLKVLFDNISQLDKQLVFCAIQELMKSTLENWNNLPFQDVEVSIAFLYLLGESVPQQTELKTIMLANMVSSDVSSHPHSSVRLQYFETCARFDKLLTTEMLPRVVAAFLDERGLRSANPNVRSRSSYLFSKLIKSLKNKLESYVEEILVRLHDLLLLPQFAQDDPAKLSNDDQLYLYEATAVLIISGQFPPDKKDSLLRQLLSPVMQSYTVYTQQLPLQTPPARLQMAEHMCHAIALTSRTSKAFSNNQTMRICNCVKIYTDAISIFDKALSLSPCEDPAMSSIHSALRQFLHRMVVCLDSNELLPFMPHTLAVMLGLNSPSPNNSCSLPDRTRPIQETIPLINQLMAKFKMDTVPMMRELFLPTVALIFKCLEVPIEPSDQVCIKDRQMLQRSYFGLIQAMVTSEIITQVISPQESQHLEQVFNTIIQGAVNFPDPIAQKTCFAILRKMVEVWAQQGGNGNDNSALIRFIYDAILPACFQAPLRDTFDLADAQTALVLSESAHCMQAVLKARGDELLMFLGEWLTSSLRLQPQQIDEYRHNLQADIKVFRPYLKVLFEHLRKRGL